MICGLPGVGKTTLARGLAQEQTAVRLCPDEWLVCLGLDLRDEAMRARLEAQLWRLAQDLLRLGQSVILEYGFWSREERDAIRLRARELGAAVAAALLVSSHRKAEPRNLSSALPLAIGAQPPLAGVPLASIFGHPSKFGMTHGLDNA